MNLEKNRFFPFSINLW